MTRLTTRNLGLALALPILAMTAIAAGSALMARSHAADDANADDTRAELMALKLDYSKNVLEGLTLEKLDLVADNARELKLLSAAAEWEPEMIPGPQYLTYTREFQRLCDELARNARDKNLDGATLSYVQLTMNCINCHKFVRTIDR